MCFDFLVLFLALYALLRMHGRSSLWNLIFIDGLVYFAIAFASYLACAITAFLTTTPWLLFIFWDTATAL